MYLYWAMHYFIKTQSVSLFCFFAGVYVRIGCFEFAGYVELCVCWTVILQATFSRSVRVKMGMAATVPPKAHCTCTVPYSYHSILALHFFNIY